MQLMDFYAFHAVAHLVFNIRNIIVAKITRIAQNAKECARKSTAFPFISLKSIDTDTIAKVWRSQTSTFGLQNLIFCIPEVELSRPQSLGFA